MSDFNTSAADAGDSGARSEELGTVAEAVREMERREKERKARTLRERAAGAEDADNDAPKKKAAPAESEDDDDGKPVKRIDDDLADDEPKKRKSKPVDEGEDADESDADDDEDADGESDDDEAQAKDRESDDEDDEDSEPKKKKAAEPAPAKIKLNLGDREVEATPDEVSSLVRETAAERQQITQARQQIAQQAQALKQQGETLAKVAQAMLGQEPPIELAQTDPGTYIAQQAQYRQRMAVLQQLQGNTSQASQVEQAQKQQAFEQTVTREREALLKAMPELADPAKLSAFQGRIAKVAQRYGLTAQDLSTAFDHRSFLMLRDLGRLADMEAERANVRKKLAASPPLKSPEQRAGSGQRNTSDLNAKAAKGAFLKSGRSMRDVKAYLDRTSR